MRIGVRATSCVALKYGEQRTRHPLGLPLVPHGDEVSGVIENLPRQLPGGFSDRSYYHLDTAFRVLPCGGVIYYPAAFTSAALATIYDHVAPSAGRSATAQEGVDRGLGPRCGFVCIISTNVRVTEVK